MTAEQTMNLAPASMQAAIEELGGPARGELSEALESILTQAAWRYAYVNARYGDGCGDQGHDYAVKCANRLLTKVRKALGYTYPERGAIRV